MIVGYSKILGLMISGSMTLTQLTKFSKLTKPTVHHHVKKLLKQQVISYNKKNGKYSIKRDSELQKQILNLLRKPKTIEELSKEFQQMAKKELQSSSVYQFANDKKNLLLKLNDLLEFLYIEGLVIETIDHILVGTIFKEEYKWTLTWVGCDKLGICHVCRKEFDKNQTSLVAQIMRRGGGEPFEHTTYVLMHPQCVSRITSEKSSDIIGGYYSNDDICNLCGLSFSENRLKQQIKTAEFGKIGFELLYDLLSKKEIESLNNWRKENLTKKFKEEWGWEPPMEAFSGNILFKQEFIISIDEKYAKKNSIKPSDESKQHDFKKGPLRIRHYSSKPFEDFEVPRLSKIDEIFENIQKYLEQESSSKSINLRVKELFLQWKEAHEVQQEKIERLISSVLSPTSRIYQKLWDTEPGPFNVDEERDPSTYGYTEPQTSLGYSFVNRDEKGNCYHERCYHSLQSTKDNLIAKEVKKTK